MFVEKEKIQKAKEKLGDKNADIIAELLNLEKYDAVNKKALCPWHLEDSPSFIYNAKTYSYHCFGCSKNTDIIDAYMYTGLTYLEALQKLFEQAKMQVPLGEKGVKVKAQYRYPKEEPINDKELVYKYLALRKISKETVDRLDVRQDAQGNIVFNYYDERDVLCLVKYRHSHKIDKSKGEIKAWCQKDADTTPLLFNMNRVNPSMPLMICEGEIDAMAAIEAGYTNTVSVPLGANNYGWIEENFDWLEQFDSIIICSDNDEAGIKMQKECIYRLGSWRTKFIDIPPYHEDEETGKKVAMKDLNHVLYYEGKQAVLNLIQNAKDTPVPSVEDLSNIEDVDLDEIEGITTGINEIDSELMKLFYGTLTLISGTPGAGKTSFLSQLVCQTLEQGKNAWIFSREMPGWMTKSWLNYILAGCNNIKEYTDRNNCKYYKVTQDAKEKINNHYKGKWFVYRDDASNKLDDLIVSMQDSIRKYGTKLLILDNLMTIDLDFTENNENQKQTEAIGKLIMLAMKFNVAIILVAHPRKLANGEELGIYSLAGSSGMVNLSHRTIGLKRLNKNNESNHDVEITIIKDRMRGRAGKKIQCFYDIPSRRFYTNENEYNYQYSWDEEKHEKLPYPHPEEYEIYGEKIDNKSQ